MRAQNTPNTPERNALRVSAYPNTWRIVAGVLIAVSRASLVGIGLWLLEVDQFVPLFALVRIVAVFAGLPACAASLIQRAFSATVELHDDELALRGRDLQVDIPYAAIARVAAWKLPLPGPGLSLWMRSGRKLSYGLELANPMPLLSALSARGGVETARAARADTLMVYADARASVDLWRWHHRLVKFVLFATLPTAVWFSAHQHIAYGGVLGQYYLEGVGPYFKTLGISWGLVVIYLVLYASVWRAVAEAGALFGTWLAPTRTQPIRRAAEITCWMVYYLGVPLLVLRPFLQ
ncbi:MAG: hypothetical protein HYR72_10780 [Deltaproteobacteria bacterium]|nr:hypothetical protein [Deltaproteobacteria bacterium]MBI3388189.1 hypothetical protein [Deltaproteobacteria bacterium]